MDKLLTREGTFSDIETIVKFQKEMALETENKTLLESSIKLGVTEVMRDKQKGTYLIGEYEGDVIGSLLLTYEWSDWRNAWFWWIQSVYVAPGHRAEGIFSSMYESVKSSAKADSRSCGIRLYVEKENDTAYNTYIGLGMQETEYRLMEELLWKI